MHLEGQTQEAIGEELGVPQRTVANVIKRLSQNRAAGEKA
jgi:DNA-binding MarR family transcriptional regulator